MAAAHKKGVNYNLLAWAGLRLQVMFFFVGTPFRAHHFIIISSVGKYGKCARHNTHRVTCHRQKMGFCVASFPEALLKT